MNYCKFLIFSTVLICFINCSAIVENTEPTATSNLVTKIPSILPLQEATPTVIIVDPSEKSEAIDINEIGTTFVENEDCKNLKFKERYEIVELEIVTKSETEKLMIELADTSEKRAQGLMCRSFIAENQGMLFTFNSPRQVNFWMYNTYIYLDLLLFSENGLLLDKVELKPCTRNEAESDNRWYERCIEEANSYQTESTVKYAIEVAAGLAEKKGWKVQEVELSLPISVENER